MSGYPVFGFPSPANDYENPVALSLDALLISKPAATQYLRAANDKLKSFGIRRGDLLVLERGRQPKHRDLIAAVIDGEFTLGFLDSESATQPVLWTPEGRQSLPEIEGVITSSVRLWQRPAELPAL
ncbi:S24 family peptidase [Ferrimonas marina]|uniref:DNA polymerase V n=1 Tax=Ferrimonas marina TaxID=299255 RepID=A0A1M5Z698_9GAMM|nr:S24 family peptidase [Ferrimonas marina]SHI19413.1 DNA polymerase V [Ferrimonas marina]